MMSPCSVMPHREPSASGGRPLTPCGNRTACLCSRNIWTVQAEDERKGKYDSLCFGLVMSDRPRAVAQCDRNNSDALHFSSDLDFNQ